MKDLVELIKKNPGAVFTIDNDEWWMNPAPPKSIDEMTDEELEAWRDDIIADSDDVASLGSGYGSGNAYGGDVLQALAVIVGVKVESV